MKKIFDTDNYLEDEYDFMIEDINYMLDEYVTKTSGVIEGFAVLSHRSSHYGSIGGNGRIGFSKSMKTNLADAILSISPSSDRAIGFVNENGELQVDFYDHDGVHHTVWHRITSSKKPRFDNLLRNSSFDEILKFINSLTTVKIKKSMLA